jgi:hypothetical protein
VKYGDFEELISKPRLSRYLLACGNNTKSAMTLYRANLRISQQMFSVLGVFEVVLRNQIDRHYKSIYRPITGQLPAITIGCFLRPIQTDFMPTSNVGVRKNQFWMQLMI